MSLVDNFNLPPEVEDLFYKSLVLRPGFYGDKIDKKHIVWRKRNFKSLIARSAFPSLGELWTGLSGAEQTAWDDAGYWAGLDGWDLFVLDTLYRINNAIPDVATPSVYHQFLVGKIEISGAGKLFTIRQTYRNVPSDYFEFFMNWKHQLTSAGAGSYAKMKCFGTTGLWNDDDDSPETFYNEYTLLYDTDWQYEEVYAPDGIYEGNEVHVEIEIYNMTGLLYIDGVEVWYDSENNAIDPQCNDFANSWQPINRPAGTSYITIYPPDNI